MAIITKEFGKLNDGRNVKAYTMISASGVEITVLDLGGIIQSIKMPGKDGRVKDVVCGYDTAQEYLDNPGYNGALIGRYANRIKGGSFVLNGVTYNVPKNENGITALHGGEIGWDKKIWAVEAGKCHCGADKLTLTYTSVDGEQGFPGNVDVKVIYRLDDNGEFVIKYHALSDKNTPIAMTNHAYFNMAGYDTQNNKDLELMLNCDKFVAVDKTFIPTDLVDVTGTAFDFRTPKLIGKDIDGDEEQLKIVGGGYDHSFVINTDETMMWKHDIVLKKGAILRDPESGRKVTLYTDAPAIQVYAGNTMGGNKFKGGVTAKKHGAVCLETGFYPDTPNRPDFPSCIFGPGKDYNCVALFKFGVEE